MKEFPPLRIPAAGVVAALALLIGSGALAGDHAVTAAKPGAATVAPAAPSTPGPAPVPTPAPGDASIKEDDEEPPTTVVTPSQESSDSDDTDNAKAAADANHCTQCQIQSDAYHKLKAEQDDANANIKKNQELQSKLKPDEDKSSWIKVESNLRMWDIKLESLKKNLSALENQMKQDCQGCPQAAAPAEGAGGNATATPNPAPTPSTPEGTPKK